MNTLTKRRIRKEKNSLIELFDKLDKKFDKIYKKNNFIETLDWDDKNLDSINRVMLIDKEGNELELIFRKKEILTLK